MTKNELEQLVRQARGMDPQQQVDYLEEWDSLDHLAILASLSQFQGGIPEGVDLSDLNSLAKLSAKICGYKPR